MATLSPCPSSPSPSGLYSQIIRPVESGGISLYGVLTGSEKLPGTSLRIADPFYLSPASPGTLALRVGTGLAIQGSPTPTLQLTATSLSPTAHAESHSPGGSDPIDIDAFGPFSPQTATSGTIGGVKPERGLTVSPDGSLSVQIDATSTALSASPGGVHLELASPMIFSSGALSISASDGTELGVVNLRSPSGLAVDGSGGLYIPGISAGGGLSGSELVFQSPNGTSPKVLINSGFVYTKVLSPGQLPLASTGSPGAIQVGNGLQINGSGILALASPIPKDNLPEADGANIGGVFTSPNTAISISSGLIDVELADSTLTKQPNGLRVSDNLFLRLTGTGVSPTASPDGWVAGLVRFTDDLGTAAINTGNNRIEYSSPSPALSGASSNALLAKSEVETLIAAASYGQVVSYGKYHAGPPSEFPDSVTVGDRFLTSVSPADAPAGAWVGQGLAFADWLELSPDNPQWVFSSPSEDQFFTDATTGNVWFINLSPSPTAVLYWTLPDGLATEARAGIVRPTIGGGLKVSGGDLTVRLGTEAGVRSGLQLTPGSGGSVLSISLPTTSSPSLEVNSSNQLLVKSGGVATDHLKGRSVTLAKLNTDIAPDGTRDFIDVDTDGITVRLRGDTDDFRVTGVPVSSATTPLIHTDDGIGIAQESLNSDSYADNSVSYSKLNLATNSGLGDDGSNKIQIALASSSGLTRVSSGLKVLLHDGGGPTIEVDGSSGGLRVALNSITAAYLAESLEIDATQLALQSPLTTGSQGRLRLVYQSPLGIESPDRALTILPGAIQSPHYGTASVQAANINLGNGLVDSGGGALTLNLVSPDLAFTGAALGIGQVPASKLNLVSPSALQDSSGNLILSAASPFIQTEGELDLDARGIPFDRLENLLVSRTTTPPTVNLSSLVEFAGLSPTGSWFNGASPAAYSLHPSRVDAGLVVNTRHRADFNYFGPAGQGQGTLTPFWRTYFDYDGQPTPPADASGGVNPGKLIPTANSIGLWQLALGNTSVAENASDSTRLPIGLGSYKELVQSGKLSSSPITSRGWSPAQLSDDIIAVKVGDGLSLSSTGQVQVEALAPSFLVTNSSPNEQSPIGFSGLVFGSVGSSPGDQALALLYDTGSLTTSPGNGLELTPTTSETFQGASIPSLSSGTYSFILGGGSPNSTTVVPDSVEIYINGLRICDSYWTASPFNDLKILQIYGSPASPKLPLPYTLTQSPSDAYSDSVKITYRLRKS